MSEQTIVAVFDTAEHAAAAVRDLEAEGIPSSAISRHASGGATTTSQTTLGTTHTPGLLTPGEATGEPGHHRGFWARLFGTDSEDEYDTVYDRSIETGSVVVTVSCSDTHATRVADILESHNPIDIDERASTLGLARSATYENADYPTPSFSTAPTDKTGGTMHLSEERLSVGKRVVNRGGARVRRFVVEVPVEQQVTLTEERVTLERRPVTGTRPAHDPDFSDKTIEMTETAEEAVVAKSAFVREEVALRKEATERVETVRDTVRREDVEIERLPGDGSVSSSHAA